HGTGPFRPGWRDTRHPAVFRFVLPEVSQPVLFVGSRSPAGARQSAPSTSGSVCAYQFPPAITVCCVIVDHPDGLHECIHDGRTDKTESAALQILAEGIGERGAGGYVCKSVSAVLHGPAVDKPPQIAVEAAEFRLYLQKRPGVGDGGVDLE